MNVERINPTELARPSGFSHAVSVNGGGATAGRMVFLAGQIGMGRDGKVVGGGVVPQFEQALGNLLTALAAAGGQPGDLVSLTLYLIDVEDYQAHGKEIGAVWRRLTGTGYPAMAGVGVTRLWDPEALVEIQGIAAVSPR
jgi:enamine deaminase RidA (YjgF/YER057c/UK114 family)